MQHSLVKYEEQPTNTPQFRYCVECSCGFASKLATEEAVKSQFDAHLRAHGCDPYYGGEQKMRSDVGQPTTSKVTTGGWNPFAKK